MCLPILATSKSIGMHSGLEPAGCSRVSHLAASREYSSGVSASLMNLSQMLPAEKVSHDVLQMSRGVGTS